MLSGYRDRIWHIEMYHADNEKRETKMTEGIELKKLVCLEKKKLTSTLKCWKRYHKTSGDEIKK